MKKKVRYSIYTRIVTIGFTAFFAALAAALFVEDMAPAAWLMLGMLAVMVGSALFFSPLSVSVDAETITLCMAVRKRRFALADVAGARICPPTMGALRIFASGGFGGYWGMFSERDLGRYFAYFGKSSDCFLLTMRNGRKYMLGCADAPQMVGYIRELSRLDAGVSAATE